MKIERAVLRELPLRLREFFEISSGGQQDRRILLLTLATDGLEGWSECVAGEHPSYAYETTETAWHVLTEYILPEIIGREADVPEKLLDPVRWVRGHQMAKASVEMAAWDLAARAEGISLSQKLGGEREVVPVGVSVGLKPTDEELHEQVQGYIEDGYARVKIKIKPGRDIEMLAGLRERFPDIAFMADANSAYSLADVDKLRELDALGLMMIEQPLSYNDFLDHARLQAQIETPVCLDESIKSEGDLALALHLGSCRIVNVKPGRVGGFAVSRRIHDTMRLEGLPVWCGGMLESGVGRAHNVALASLPGFTLPGDISASRRYWERDIVSPEFEVADGMMKVPRGPGIGVDLDIERIQSLTVREASFG
ncbi:MAG TPA: o-succinylbenzoate synthase [Gemmatimonadetes bacterium]|nr:o-succinylbenzoate synthase [Gemmatimonadota bacterium]HIN78372.1 o-succinylbenzoate synthase [Gemmatimonadota bacterium]